MREGIVKFLVGISSPLTGSHILGLIEVEEGKKTRERAQKAVIEKLVAAGVPPHTIGVQVTDYSTLEIGLNTITIVPVADFGYDTAAALSVILAPKK